VRLLEGSNDKVVHTELNGVLTHETGAHTNKWNGDSIMYKLVFNVDRSLADDVRY
jgi:hypothetical protein